MLQWNVTIKATKDPQKISRSTWVEQVRSIDKVSARYEGLLQAEKRQPRYTLYETGAIIKAKA